MLALKVQVHIGIASSVYDTYVATLHYQMAYILQNYAFDISHLTAFDEALFVSIYFHTQASCVHIPREFLKRS